MKTLSRRFKKHVINNSNQTLENKQDDIHQIATSFKPIHSPKAQNFITQNSYPPVGTPPSQCNNVDSDSKETDLVAESLRRRKNNSCPPSAASSPLILSEFRPVENRSTTGKLKNMKGTSFGSTSQLHVASKKKITAASSAFSFTHFAPSIQKNSPFSSSSASSSQSLSENSSPSESPSLLTNSAAQFYISPREEKLKNSEKENKVSKKEPSADRNNNTNNSGVRKKLPFHRKGKEKHFIKQSSKDDVLQPQLQSRSSSVEAEDLPPASETSEMLEKFKEENEALEIEVRGKDEEVRRLNATIDQVNQTWENKLQATMRDLEEEKKKNEHLRAKLNKETAAAQAAKKSILRIPFEQHSRARATSVVIDYHVKRNSTDKDLRSSTNTINQKKLSPVSVSSPRTKRKGIREAHRVTEVTIREKNDDVKQRLVSALMSSTCLSQLSRDDLIIIADVMNSKRINKGERLMKEGMLGQAFYILAEGDCRIYKRNQESVSPNLSDGGRPVKQWEIFGEADVFYHTRRVWSCKCVRSGTVYYISRDEFRASIMQQDIQRLRREIMRFLKQVQSLNNLTAIEFRMLANVSRISQYAEGDYIIRQGSSSSCVYILKEGQVTVTKIIDGSETRLETFSTGQILGTSLSSIRHQNNVVASGKETVQCVTIPNKHFEKIRDRVTLPSSDVTATKVTASLAKRDLLGDGQDSLSSGHTGSASSGYGSDISSPNVRRKRNNKRRYNGDHHLTFVQKSSILENKNVDDFDVIATIGKGAFGSVTLSQLKGSETSVYAIKADLIYVSSVTFLDVDRHMVLQDDNCLVTLMQFRFEPVDVEKISKYEVVASEQQKNVFSEKSIQMDSSRDCPFIASLYSTFKDKKFVYFVMEFCQGGELFSFLSQSDGLDDSKACFYASCILEALTHLHTKHVIFRDLKPENVVIDTSGYCKLTDFGFAKKVSAKSSFRTYTYCGTPEYMAPETILYHAQSFAVDIWSFGVFVFELLAGRAPFRSKNRVALADSILNGIAPVLENASNSFRIGKLARSLIRELCRTRPEDRLGVGKNGISEVAKHAWFNQIDWNALRQRTLTPPWKPTLGNEKDLRYFSSSSKSRDTVDAIEELSGWDDTF